MDQKNIVRDIIVGLTMTLVSLTVIVLIPRQIQLATTFGEDIGVNSRTFPYFTTGIIGIAAVLHLIVSIVKFIKLKSTAAKGVDREPNGNLYGEVLSIIMFILFAIYAVLFQKLGYILSSIVVPPIILVALKSKKLLHYVSVYGFIALIFIIFQYLLKIQLIR